MKKRIALLLAALLAVGSLTACGGGNNEGSNNDDAATVNVGLGLYTDMAHSSKDATAEAAGLAQADLTVAAVTVDADGKIVAVKFDCIQVKTNFDATGTLTADTPTEFKTKRELGYDYNMKGTSAGIGVIEGGAEWFEQADALESFCVGKTIEEVKAAVGEDGKPADENLLLGCTMTVSGFVVALDKAVAEANTGVYTASANDTLSVGLVAEVSNPASATAEAEGAATAYANFVAVTSDAEGKITTCILDSVQAKFAWDTTGVITSDKTVDTTTKYDLKEDYNMKGASAGKGTIEGGAEWYEQADAFMAHVKGMTVDQVKAIAIDEAGYPTDENLTLGCTMKVSAYISAVEKALSK
ncbi:MAG: hypothetical protein IJ958_08930 [Agathobacter sp.]|nr:hypothetical protein [Agathobacter sp.]